MKEKKKKRVPPVKTVRVEKVVYKDVHVDNCCVKCGCKYGVDECPVLNKEKQQTKICEGKCLKN